MSGLAAALSFYTRLPIGDRAYEPTELARSAPWFPVVGFAIGTSIAAIFASLSFLLPSLLAAVIGVSAGAVLTGAFHEDGLGDVADAFAGAWTVERRLEILDDPRQGTFGVIALTAAFVARVAALSSLGAVAALALVPAAHAMSRVPAVVLMRRAPLAKQESLAAAFAGGLSARHELAAVAIGIAIGAALVGLWVVPIIAIAVAVAAAMTALARRKIGGISGDVLGAIQQLTEIGVLTLGAAIVHERWGEIAWWWP